MVFSCNLRNFLQINDLHLRVCDDLQKNRTGIFVNILFNRVDVGQIAKTGFDAESSQCSGKE
ncbi:hypothetical protein SDC9_196398 [bioreactor metagenome]|uniref:Uncharacterized protein n=1 Tax=bioreactor metagenome TaxID=1076179 RepID=A0A645ICZ6_9ZZZZ